MGLSRYLYLALLAAVGVLRLVELRISRKHQERMLTQGAVRVPEPHFKWMVVVHTGVLVSAALEVVLLHRPFLPLLGATMLALFSASNLMRKTELTSSRREGEEKADDVSTVFCI